MDIVLDFATTSAILFIVTSGLMMIFGVMQIVNFAHGAILSLGGYVAFTVTQLGMSSYYSWIIAILVGIFTGAVIEKFVVRPLYKRPQDAILATWGLGIVIIQLIVIVFGRSVQLVESPLQGTRHILGVDYSSYRLAMIPIAVVIAVLIIGLLNGTRTGVRTRAVIMNEYLAESLGINANIIRFFTFSLGAGLGTFAGMMITPLSSEDPYMGVSWLTNAFMLVMVSGHSFVSLIFACLLFGPLQVLISIYINPVIGGMAISILAAATLRIRPKGFCHD